MANVGTWMHDNFELIEHLLLEDAESLTKERLPPGLEKEFRIEDPSQPPLRRSRVDRVDWANGEVIEIKPEHLREAGEREAAIYAQEMDRFHSLGPGRRWKSRCITYDQARAIGYLVEIGYFTRSSLDVHPLYSWRAEAYMANQIPPRAAKPPKQTPTPQVSSDAGLRALYALHAPQDAPAVTAAGGAGRARPHAARPRPRPPAAGQPPPELAPERGTRAPRVDPGLAARAACRDRRAGSLRHREGGRAPGRPRHGRRGVPQVV